MKHQNLFFRKWMGFSLVTLILLAGCGGGGGAGDVASGGVISGTAIKGPVSGDGRMDGVMTGQGGMGSGMMGSNQIEMGGGMMAGTVMPADAGTKGLADAMAQFINSPMNRSGLTMQDMQNLISKLTTSNGVIQ